MTVKLSKTCELVLNAIRKNPDIATFELKPLLPELTSSQVHNAVSYLKLIGLIRVSGRRTILTSAGYPYTHATYTAKYTRRPAPEAPEAPEVKDAPEVQVSEDRDVVLLRHLTDIYKALSIMTEQQDALIEVLKGTLLDLAETKQQLDEAQARRNWWDAVKEWFA